jgi:hypothetical protein
MRQVFDAEIGVIGDVAKIQAKPSSTADAALPAHNGPIAEQRAMFRAGSTRRNKTGSEKSREKWIESVETTAQNRKAPTPLSNENFESML